LLIDWLQNPMARQERNQSGQLFKVETVSGLFL